LEPGYINSKTLIYIYIFGVFNDISFCFFSLGISSFQTQAENAVLDLDADEAGGVIRAKNSKRW
jgi:hypothetical protein